MSDMYLFDNKGPWPGRPILQSPPQKVGLITSHSGGFEFSDARTDWSPTANGPVTSNAQVFFNNPDMGFFGVSSPPGSINKVDEWMAYKDQAPPEPKQIRIITKADNGDGELLTMSPRSIPNSPLQRWALVDRFSFSPRSTHSIPNSPPQSPLYRRQSPRWQKVFEEINESEEFRPNEFLQSKKCYDLIPSSGKLIVFDKKLLVRKAFTALITHGTRAAPVWDSQKQEYIGMLTITDFIRILHSYQVPGAPDQYRDIEEAIELGRIEEWKKMSEGSGLSRPSALLSVEPTATIFEAAKILLEHKIHRLPVIDSRSGNTLYIITHKRILNFLYPYLEECTLPRYFYMSLRDLGIGTYQNDVQLTVLTYDSPLSEAIKIFAETRVSAIPIVDDNKQVVDIYARFDVISIATRRKYNNLNVTLKECLQLRSSTSVNVETCKTDDLFLHVVQRIYKAQVHRLVVVDNNHHVLGLVSLSDVFRFLVYNCDDFD